MKLTVSFFILDKKPLAEYINPSNGKVSYFDASLVIKKVLRSPVKYKVKVKKGRVTKVLSQIQRKRIRKKDIEKVLKKIKDTI